MVGLGKQIQLLESGTEKTVSELRLVQKQEDKDHDLGMLWEHKQKYLSGDTNIWDQRSESHGLGTQTQISVYGAVLGTQT